MTIAFAVKKKQKKKHNQQPSEKHYTKNPNKKEWKSKQSEPQTVASCEAVDFHADPAIDAFISRLLYFI